MAIGQPFNQQFGAGDVVYGISQARGPYINSLPNGVAQHLRAQGLYVICDEYNNRTFGNVPGLDNLPFPQTRNAVRGNVQAHAHVAYLNPLQKASAQSYYEALRGTKYRPTRAVRTGANALQAKGNAHAADLAFRRACKFGLQYIIEQRRRTVHFVLDVPAAYNVPGNRIQSLDVATKQQHAGHVPITTSELRKCYRMRGSWIPTGRLKFYFNLIEVHPPWVTDQAEWAVYEAHRVRKGVV